MLQVELICSHGYIVQFGNTGHPSLLFLFIVNEIHCAVILIGRITGFARPFVCLSVSYGSYSKTKRRRKKPKLM